MKIFAVYFRVNLTQKPEWFDGFRKKYDDPYDLHMTFIQPRYIDESEIENLKSKVTGFVDNNKLANEDKPIDFNKFSFNPKPEDKYTLMLEAEKANGLIGFQKNLREDLKDFGKYIKEKSEQNEANFRPHITFGRNTPKEIFEEMKAYFQLKNIVKGVIGEMVLTIVPNDSIEEAMNPKNLTIFNAFKL